MPLPSTLGGLKQSHWSDPAVHERTVKDEMRANLIRLLEEGRDESARGVVEGAAEKVAQHRADRLRSSEACGVEEGSSLEPPVKQALLVHDVEKAHHGRVRARWILVEMCHHLPDGAGALVPDDLEDLELGRRRMIARGSRHRFPRFQMPRSAGSRLKLRFNP